MTRLVYTDKDSVPLKAYIGVKNHWQFTMTNDDGSVLDATGYSFFCEVRDKPGGKLLATLSVDETDIATGVLVLNMTMANSLLIGQRSAVYDVLMQQDATPTNTVRLWGGIFELEPTVTEV